MSFVANGIFEGLIRSLDVDPHRRGKQFEKIVKWWLQNDPIHSRDIKKVWLWDEWPDRPGPDVGIDLVAELKDGSLVAVQAKCFDSERDIPKSELDSFISAASPRKYGRRMLVASTDGLSANARRMLHDNHVTQVMFSYLDSLQEFWPSTFLSLGGPRTISKWGPRTHQSLAIHDVTEGLRKASRGQLIMACGTGKTLTAMWIMESLDSHSTLVLVPSLSLLSQTLLEWSQHSNVSWSYLCVCSDDTVNKSDDAIISSIDDVPFPVTTKPSEIAHFLSQRGRKIIFSTYQSSAQIARGMKSVGKKFDLVICDEAHRLTGKNDAEFATALDDKKIPAKKRLFMTATPRTYTASVKSKASERGVEITSMDDETAFGKELHKLSFGQAIEQELLTDYRVVIVGVTDPQVQDLIERRELVTAGNVETDARTLAAHIGLAKATKDYDLKRTISFHGRIKTAQAFAQNHASIVEWMPDDHKPSGTIWADTITGAMNSSSRRKLLDKLKENIPGQHALLSNARCLTEGIDVPSLDGVAFIDPRSSQVDIIQAVGRAIRKADSKTLGTIVLPVLIPHDISPELALEDSSFKPIWAILKALRSHDELLGDQLDEIRVAIGRGSSNTNLPDKILLSVPQDIDRIFPNLSSKLSISLVERVTTSWNWWFGKLTDYAEKSGHSSPPSNVAETRSLAGWVSEQRMSYNGTTSKKLNSEQCAKLESLPNWVWNIFDSAWNSNYEKLSRYARKRNNLQFSNREKFEGVSLAHWVMRQRQSFFAGNLEDYKRDLLEQISNWEWNPIDSKWEKDFLKLQKYKVETDGSNPLPKEVHNGFRVGSWVVQQRVKYRNDMLTEEQIRRLEDLENWTWDPGDLEWTNKFNATVKYAQREGRLKVGTSYREDGLLIGKWIAHQRGCHKKGILSKERQRLMESIPGWQWNPVEDAWMTNFLALKNFTETNQLQELPESNLVTKLSLLTWMRTQRVRYSKGAIPSHQIVLIESIPGWYWIRTLSRWDISFNALSQYAEESGTAMAPESFRDSSGIWLGRFCQKMRNDYRNGSLSDERIAMLEQLAGWEWYPYEAEWRRKFESLSELAMQNGSLTTANRIGISQTLRTWSSAQRTAYIKGNLDQQKIVLLESINGWTWDPLKSAWEDGFLILEKYVLQNGHARVPHGFIFDGFNLGSWVLGQRKRFAEQLSKPDQEKRLESLNGWVWVAQKSK